MPRRARNGAVRRGRGQPLRTRRNGARRGQRAKIKGLSGGCNSAWTSYCWPCSAAGTERESFVAAAVAAAGCCIPAAAHATGGTNSPTRIHRDSRFLARRGRCGTRRTAPRGQLRIRRRGRSAAAASRERKRPHARPGAPCRSSSVHARIRLVLLSERPGSPGPAETDHGRSRPHERTTKRRARSPAARPAGSVGAVGRDCRGGGGCPPGGGRDSGPCGYRVGDGPYLEKPN